MNKISAILFFLVIIVAVASCDKENNNSNEYSFNLETKFDSIRSCPGGGGLFIIKMINYQNQAESVNLRLKCDSNLNATLSKNSITVDQSVFEVLVKPSIDIPISDYIITLLGERIDQHDSLKLKVKLLDWENSSELNDISLIKKTEFIDWLNTAFPDINITNETGWETYLTYPQTLIVEHYTLLNYQYEMRICCHAMTPPHDWSMIRLRERNSFTAFLAARQDSTGGIVYQIPVEDYPLKYGY